MDLSHYQQLPDGMDEVSVAREFERLLAEAQQPGVSPIHVAQAFWELADRQWHTYELLRPDLRLRVEKWFEQHWLPDQAFLRWVGGVAGSLGSTALIPLLRQTTNELGDAALGRELRQTLLEIEPHIDDPYWSLKQQR